MSSFHAPKTVTFSRILDCASVGDAGLRQTIEANEAEREALAIQDGLLAVASLTASLKIRRDGRFGIRVTGELSARIRQTCVVTLDEFDADVVEPIEVRFLPESELEAEAARRARIQPIAGAEEDIEDLPDLILNGRIDLGALVAEHLALGLDPYPKKPGTTFVEPSTASDDEGSVSPFAALSRLKTS